MLAFAVLNVYFLHFPGFDARGYYPNINPHNNQTSNGTWSITSYKIGVDSVWYQDDLHQLLYLTSGDFNNMYYMDAFWFNNSGYYEIIKTNKSSAIRHHYECDYSVECDYNCEIDGYSDLYLQYAGEYVLISPQFANTTVYSFIGPALDAVGVLPTISYASYAYDNPNVLLYRGMDVFMSFGGLGRYYFPGDLLNQVPNYNVIKNIPNDIGCPNYSSFIDNFENKYNQPSNPNIDQYQSMTGKGIYYDERNDVCTDTWYYINDEQQIFNLTVGTFTYFYNASTGIMYDHMNGNFTIMNRTYKDIKNGLNGYPTDIAYNGRYLVANYTFVNINITDFVLEIFSGNVLYFDGSIQPMIKYFDSKTKLLVGMDIIKIGVDRSQIYDVNKTGYKRFWFTDVSPLTTHSLP
eukprot:929960_1